MNKPEIEQFVSDVFNLMEKEDEDIKALWKLRDEIIEETRQKIVQAVRDVWLHVPDQETAQWVVAHLTGINKRPLKGRNPFEATDNKQSGES